MRRQRQEFLFRVPCRRQEEGQYPVIACGLKCEECGFNPKEQRRRLKTGVWVRERGIRRLVFRKAQKPEEAMRAGG